MSVLKSASRVFGANSVAAVVAVVGVVLFARVLGATTFGVFVLFQGVVNVISVFVDLGIDEAVEKRISEGVDERRAGTLLTTALVVEMGVVVIIGLLLVAFTGEVNGYLGRDVVLYLPPVLLAERVGWLLIHALRGEQSVERAAFLGTARQVTFVGSGLALSLAGLGIAGAIIGYALGWTVVIAEGYRSLELEITTVGLDAGRSLYRYSKYNFVGSVLQASAYSWIDVLVIGLFLPQASVAAYEIAWRITQTVILFSEAIAHALFPKVSEWSSAESMDRIGDVVPDALTGSLLFVVPAIAGLLIVHRPLLSFVFGSGYLAASGALLVLMVGKIPEAANRVYLSVLFGLNRPDLVSRSATVFIALNVALNLSLVPQYGLVGAAVATVASYTVTTLMNRRYLSRFISPRVNGREIVSVIAASVGMGTILWLVSSTMSVRTVFDVGALIGLGVALYAGFLFLFPTFRSWFSEISTG